MTRDLESILSDILNGTDEKPALAAAGVKAALDSLGLGLPETTGP